MKVCFIVFLFLASCEKESEIKSVTYEVSNAISEVTLSYLDGNNTLINSSAVFNSREDIWKLSFEGKKGDIVYLSAKYDDTASSVAISIIIDGKIYKKALSNNDPGKFVTIAGVVPY